MWLKLFYLPTKRPDHQSYFQSRNPNTRFLSKLLQFNIWSYHFNVIFNKQFAMDWDSGRIKWKLFSFSFDLLPFPGGGDWSFGRSNGQGEHRVPCRRIPCNHWTGRTHIFLVLVASSFHQVQSGLSMIHHLNSYSGATVWEDGRQSGEDNCVWDEGRADEGEAGGEGQLRRPEGGHQEEDWQLQRGHQARHQSLLKSCQNCKWDAPTETGLA